MIIKLVKGLYNMENDYAVCTPYGELICKIAKLTRGYYIYNKLGEQIAQVGFNENIATLAIANKSNNVSTVVKLAKVAPGRFEFLKEIYEKQDMQFLANLNGKNQYDFSIWGNVLNYSYDIYDGKVNVAAVVPSSAEKDFYTIDLGARANVLYVIMIALSIEKLSFSNK